MSLMSGIDSGIPESAISPSNIIPLFEKQRGLRFHAWKLFATMLVHLLTVPAFLVRFGILVYRGQLSNKENRKLLVSFAMSALAYTMSVACIALKFTVLKDNNIVEVSEACMPAGMLILLAFVQGVLVSFEPTRKNDPRGKLTFMDRLEAVLVPLNADRFTLPNRELTRAVDDIIKSIS